MLYPEDFNSIGKKYFRRTNNFTKAVSIDFSDIYGYNGSAV